MSYNNDSDMNDSDNNDSDNNGSENSKNDSSNIITYDDGRDRSLSSREAERRQLQEDMERFLNGGGQIKQIDKDVRMDPPRKPESNYGSRPI
ncbi:hypothetical protein [Ketobacter sp.]|uniref:hypothetical protein n=1 Tax=Ketobacter sp. TaxID=2083498 RepID=UPI0025BECA93|nr:hypothetical protein [Ketobacter sp.]